VVKLFFDKYVSESVNWKVDCWVYWKKNAKHVVYDAVSESEALDAFETVYGERALVDYFSKASLIVSVGADFLGDWQGGGFDAGYAKGRIPKAGKMSVIFN
jgi:molybdopterin-containing oxidoreductase family iron-sulfur binding subunit